MINIVAKERPSEIRVALSGIGKEATEYQVLENLLQFSRFP